MLDYRSVNTIYFSPVRIKIKPPSPPTSKVEAGAPRARPGRTIVWSTFQNGEGTDVPLEVSKWVISPQYILFIRQEKKPIYIHLLAIR